MRLVGCWRLVVAGMIVRGSLSSARSTKTKSSINYIRSEIIDDYMAARGKTLNIKDVFAWTIVTGSDCECRMLCWAHRKCKAVAVHALPDAKDKNKCLLADHGPLTSKLLPDSTAYYFFWIDGIPGKYYGIFLDNLLYVELNEMTSWERAKELCARIPGHRLAMYKTTTQQDIMMELYFKNPRKGMLINARKTSDGKDRVWGDKTKFSSLPKVKLMFIDAGMHRPVYTVFLSRIYGKEKSAGHDRVVCQANPRGVEW